jgi:hypothetical protein
MKRYVYLGAAGGIVAALLLAAALWWGWTRTPEAEVARAIPQKVFVVQELNWRFPARGDPYIQDEGRPGKPIKVFVDRDRAWAFCRDLNRQKRAGQNPFWYQPEPTDGSYLDQYASKGDDALLAFVRSEGLTPPIRDPDPSKGYHGLYGEPWVIWWDKHREGWDDRLVERLWEALDRVRFYEVVELPLER